MKTFGLLLVASALLTGCASTPAAAPVTSAPAATTAAAKAVSSEQIAALSDGLRKIDRGAAEGAFDKAQAVCAQIADGAHGEGFTRGVALRFDVDPSKGQAVVDAIKAAGVC